MTVQGGPRLEEDFQGAHTNGDTTKYGNTFGYALNWVNLARRARRMDPLIGYELSLINELEVYKNPTSRFGCGYPAGKRLKSLTHYPPPADKPKGPYIITRP